MPPSTENLIAENQRLRAELRRSRSRITNLIRQATTDDLTRLLNRRGFVQAAQDEIDAARNDKRPLTLIYIDLDGLKATNDQFGHEEGDALLIETATLLRRVFRAADPVARLGGDEFVILARGFHGTVDTIQKRIDAVAAVLLNSGAQTRKISLSIGMVFVDPEQSDDLEDLLSRADTEMYAAKRRKRQARQRDTQRPAARVEQRSAA